MLLLLTSSQPRRSYNQDKTLYIRHTIRTKHYTSVIQPGQNIIRRSCSQDKMYTGHTIKTKHCTSVIQPGQNVHRSYNQGKTLYIGHTISQNIVHRSYNQDKTCIGHTIKTKHCAAIIQSGQNIIHRSYN